MGTYEELKAAIQQVIKTNNNNEITGQLLQDTLLAIVNNIGRNATFAGIATPETNPGTLDQNVFYIATQPGTYIGFNGIEIGEGEIAIIANSTGSWEKHSLGNFQINSIEIEYEDIVRLRNTSSLIPGRFYRITDYITTTTQENTQSAGHPFDVIVLALSGSELSEEAWAIQSARDTDGYFSNSALSGWKIWYSLDNDAERFAWADTENGKGVIYRMIDEWGNDCPYDFKNIQFKRFAVTEYDKVPSLVVDNEENYYGYYYGALTLDGRQVIQEATYGEDFVWVYTFALKDMATETWHDYTILNSVGLKTDESVIITCHSNVIKEYRDEYLGEHGRKAIWLNNIVFFNCYADISSPDYSDYYSFCYDNSFGNGCSSNSFGNNCYDNSFGNGCSSNSFGSNCNYNSFGNNCSSNSFGNDCSSNSFGNSCYANSFVSGCSSNIFGNSCSSNIFGSNCNYNSFGNNCSSNSFGNDCSSNSFGNGCSSNSFGNNCSSNSFGSGCYYNSFGNYFRYNKVSNGVSVTLSNSQTASSNQQVQNYQFTNGLVNETIEVERNRGYETTVAIDSSGNVKQFCIADLIQ